MLSNFLLTPKHKNFKNNHRFLKDICVDVIKRYTQSGFSEFSKMFYQEMLRKWPFILDVLLIYFNRPGLLYIQ